MVLGPELFRKARGTSFGGTGWGYEGPVGELRGWLMLLVECSWRGRKHMLRLINRFYNYKSRPTGFN